MRGLATGAACGSVSGSTRTPVVSFNGYLPAPGNVISMKNAVHPVGGGCTLPIQVFGPLGFIIGPIVAALFVTAWELYGTAFEDLLPPAPSAPASVMEFGSTYPPPPVAPKPGPEGAAD